MMPICYVLVLLSLLLVLADSKSTNSRRDRYWKAKMDRCEAELCSQFLPDEGYNCVNKCTSDACFAEIYETNPLEDGEVDHDRNRLFNACLRSEYSELLKQGKLPHSGF